jgi:hypothetical protein
MSKCVFGLCLGVHTYAIRSLLTDPKSRKVIVIEHPLLPLYVKDILAKILFENLQVLLSFKVFLSLTDVFPGSVYIICF